MSRARGRPRPSVSVVVPVRDEADSLGPLVAEIGRALDGWLDYELIVVDDGSVDATWERLDALARATPRLRPIRHRAGYGQSAALWTGIRGSRGHWIVTLDGDGQNDPADIPRLLRTLQAAGAGGPVLVLGHRTGRRASAVRRLSSRVANTVRGRLLGDRAPDSGCGLKAFERRAFLALPYFDHMHRFLPALFLRAGGRVVSVPVADRPRVHGASKYGVHDRLWVGLVDLLGVMWLQARGRMPLVDAAAGPARLASASPKPGGARGWIAAWLLVVASTLLFRPLLPVDETRYAAVAWEMWLRGDFLVPYLNGQPYSDKPPLLFWAIHLGWWLFGVTDWWARLVSPLFGLGALALTAALARQLWPDRPEIGRCAPWLLLGTVAWAVATTLTMFDMALAFCALLGLLGVARAWRGGGWRNWAALALATGLGLLAKGPVVLLFIVPVALAAPWWGRTTRSWWRWYAAVASALAAGALVALAWAVPAAERGGTAYGAALLWTQTVDRLAASFAHRRPVWWYVPILPVLLLPWTAWSGLWRPAAAHLRRCGEPGVRFVIVWFAAAFAGLSLISGKQAHYVLPVLPAVGLLAARVVLDGPGPDPARRLRALALASVTLVAVANVVMPPATGNAWDVAPLAARIHAWQEEGRPVAHVGKYHGQFHFPGRLTRSLEVIDEGTERQWLRRHPEGRIVVYQPRGVRLPSGAAFAHPYRLKTAVVLEDVERRGDAVQPRAGDSDS